MQGKGLKNTTVVLMIATALFFDALQILLSLIYMGWVVGIFAGLTFWFWFRTHGISFMKPKRFAAFGGATLLEVIPIPFVASIPAWTAAVLYLALESKTKKIISQVPGGQMAASVVGNKMVQNKNFNQVNNMSVAKPMSNNGTVANLASQREESSKLFSSESFNKRKQEREEHFERMRQMNQRAVHLQHGGKEKWEQHLVKSKKEWDIGTGKSSYDKAA